MEDNKNQKSARESVLKIIESGQAKMIPKRNFVIRAAIAAISEIIIFLMLLYLASFILFILKQTGVLFMPIFGLQGWYVFFAYFPWFLIFISLIFVIILEMFVRHYPFAYRRPLLYSGLVIIFFVLLGGIVVEGTSLHKILCEDSEKSDLPVVGPLCRQYERQELKDIHRGRITKIINSGFVVRSQRGEILIVNIIPKTRLPYGAGFVEGDTVVIFGNRDHEMIQAIGIRQVGE